MGQGSRYSVVVVDDDADVRDVLQVAIDMSDRLEWIGEAANGEEAVDVVSRHEPDAVILDLRMPVMDGRTALRLLRAGGFDGVIVVHAAEFDASELKGEGASEVCDKSIQVHHLMERVTELCTQPTAGLS